MEETKNKLKKKRRRQATRHDGIYKIQFWDQSSRRWIDPKRGNSFEARRYYRNAKGKPQQESQSFATILEAKAFRNEQTLEALEKEVFEVESETKKQTSSKMTFGEFR